MRRIILCLALIAFGLTSVSFPASAANGEPKVKVTASRLNVRELPGTDARILGSAVRGDILTRLEEQSDWVKIRTTEGLVGWVSRAHVEPWAAPELEGSSEPADPETRIPPQDIAPSVSAGKSPTGRRILKYACLVGAGATAVLGYTEHSAGNDTYEKYKDLARAGDEAAAEIQYDKTGKHDDKAQTWMIVSGVLAGAYLLQEFVLERGGDDRAALERSPRLRFGWDPYRGEATAAVVVLRY